MKKFCFVILNYNTYDMTVDCINSIEKVISFSSNINYNIVIVDNNSSDFSGKKLEKKYKNNKLIKVILNSENSGFSKGNNLGIRYANTHFTPDFVVVNNSDTELISNNFFDQIIKIYNRTNFALLGPKIIKPDSKCQYYPRPIREKKQIRHAIIYYICMYILTFFNIKNKYKLSSYDLDDENVNKEYYDVVIHGCFLIFSKKYFEYYDGIPEITKFYAEEELIYLNVKSQNLLSVYNPNIRILHRVNGSVSKIKGNRNRLLFKYSNFIKSNICLYKIMSKERR